jgi:hypothetical protein
MAMPDSPTFQLLYFPYLSLDGTAELSFGAVRVWNADKRLAEAVPNARLRRRVAALLRMNTVPTRGNRRVAVRGIGIVTIGTPDCRMLGEPEFALARELRTILFLTCLSQNTLAGPNGGFLLYTAENFDLVAQTFTASGKDMSGESGVLIRVREMGYRITSTRFPKPRDVNQPSTFQYDEALFCELERLRHEDEAVYRRIVRAADVFLGSYFNSDRVSWAARILLQAAAFEILLDLPEIAPRKAFKDRIEQYCGETGERRYRTKYEDHGVKKPDERTLKGVWADRFYFLRNRIVHGEDVRDREYLFCRQQHHVLIASLFFVLTVKRLIDERREARELPRMFADRIDWETTADPDEPGVPRSGFRLRPDLARLWLAAAPAPQPTP